MGPNSDVVKLTPRVHLIRDDRVERIVKNWMSREQSRLQESIRLGNDEITSNNKTDDNSEKADLATTPPPMFIKIETEAAPDVDVDVDQMEDEIDIVHSIVVGGGDEVIRRTRRGRIVRSVSNNAVTRGTDKKQSGHKRVRKKEEYRYRPKTVECPHCGKMFVSQKHLALHVGPAHDNVRYPCSVCGKELSSPRHCAAHEAVICKVIHPPKLLKDLGVRIWTCGVAQCGKMFSREKDLDYHTIAKHDTESPYKCSECGEGFTRKTWWIAHEKKCKISSADDDEEEMNPTRTTGSMKNNELKYNADKEMQIKTEPLPSPITSPVDNNIRPAEMIKTEPSFLHDDTEPTSCDTINAPTIFVGGPPNLDDTREIKSETPIVPNPTTIPKIKSETKSRKKSPNGTHIRGINECDQCDEVFSSVEKLALHLRTVHPDVKYPCSECGKVLLSERHRVAHEVIICKVVHPPELLKKLCVKIHKCGVGRCGQLFSRKNNLDIHVRKKHGDR
ncbi:zinc finger protein 665 [Folsomia candida]|uniref:zinc finger protein 665 n=1 Tax=Folsomia candida TaxID=158441 RepID=UPI000B9039A3|nr:zinc finger protein 665 [Folsomia candida]XP_035716794.1 zinc finger protein 665 [Folsomia candida]